MYEVLVKTPFRMLCAVLVTNVKTKPKLKIAQVQGRANKMFKGMKTLSDTRLKELSLFSLVK